LSATLTPALRHTTAPMPAGTSFVPFAGFRRIATWFVLSPAIIDYRFENPTAASLAFYALLTVLSLVGTFILVLKAAPYKGSSTNWGAAIAAGFALVALLTGYLHGQQLMDLVRAAPPLVLFTNALIATSALRAMGSDPRAIWRDSVAIGLIALLVQLAAAIVLRHASLATARYEVLSSTAPLLSAYAVTQLLFGGLTLATIPIIAMQIGVILVSVTRTQIVVAALPAFLAILSTGGRLLMRREAAIRVFAVGAAAASAVLIAFFLPGSPMERWSERLVGAQSEHHSIDVTALARTGEARFQIDQLGSHVDGLLLGFGVAAPTAFDSETAALIDRLVGDNNGEFTETGFGHNQYVGTFFVGGLLAGGALLFVQLRAIFCAMKSIHRLFLSSSLQSYRSLIGFPMAYLAFSAFGLLGGTLGARGSAVFWGFTLGMTLWIFEATGPLRPSNAAAENNHIEARRT
jgi:hypothetical protein